MQFLRCARLACDVRSPPAPDLLRSGSGFVDHYLLRPISSSFRGGFLIVEKRHRDHFTVLCVEGLVKLGESAQFFSAALENVLKHEITSVIIDFTRIDYIDSTGIGELVGYLGKFTNQNRKLILVNPSERIHKLLRLAKLDAVFKIYGTEEEAISAESGAAAHS